MYPSTFLSYKKLSGERRKEGDEGGKEGRMEREREGEGKKEGEREREVREERDLITFRKQSLLTFIGSSGCHATSTPGDFNWSTLTSFPASRSHTWQQRSSRTTDPHITQILLVFGDEAVFWLHVHTQCTVQLLQ